MRVAHVINSLGTGGAESLVVNLAASMRAAGHDVSILTVGNTEGVPLRTAHRLGLDVVAVGRSPYDFGSIPRLRKHLRDFDVAHVHLFPSLYITPLAAGRTPLVYTEHSTWNRRRDARAFRQADRLAYRRYDSIVAISDGVRDSLRAYLAQLGLNREVPVISNGVPDEFFDRRRLRTLAGDVRLIAVGTLDDRKNFGDAIRAVADLPGVGLTIVGDGPQRSELSQLIVDYGVGDRVVMTGSSSQVGELMDQHDVLLSTSKFEGFSLVAAEAMAMGLPVVGPDVPGFRDSVLNGTAGILFEQSAGIPAIVGAITRVTANPDAYQALSEGATANAERFRLTRAAEAYLDLYRTLRSTSPR